MKEIITNIVNSSQGIKAVELVLKVMEEINPVKFDEKEYNKCLTELINNKEIVEIEYILHQMDYRIKSIYFPKGTIIHS